MNERRSSGTASSDPYVTALRLLAGRELSSLQVRERLHRRAFPPDGINKALARLQEEGSLDDRRTAFAYARTAVKLKSRGRFRLIREIEALGVSAEIAHEAVTAAYTEISEEEVLERALARHLEGSVKNWKQAGRLQQALRRQGFSDEMILAALKRRGLGRGDTE